MNSTDHVGTKGELLEVQGKIEEILKGIPKVDLGNEEDRIRAELIPREVEIEVVRIKGMRKKLVFSKRKFEGYFKSKSDFPTNDTNEERIKTRAKRF